MDKHYDPHSIEKRWYQIWEENEYFVPNDNAKAYCIMIPPPNVTGILHMGHAFQDTIMDALTRYHRMLGHSTLWQPGTDHAGIATQMVVERKLNAEGKTRHDLGRDEFINRVWDWKEHSGGTITRQLRRMGASVDWSRERFTMDEGLSAAVREVFVRLYEDGLIYRGKRLVNWDPVLHTAVSDLEVVAEEESGHLWHMRYPLSDGSGYLIVATTRPETMLGDSAVAVHPDDERYKDLLGKSVILPLAEREIPVIADEYVDMDFGAGCVKITPAHDFNDYAVGMRHSLELLNIFTEDAKILASGAVAQKIPAKYHGLDRFAAREEILKDLQNLGLLLKTEPHVLKVPRSDRTQAIVEPYLTDQWFVKTAPLAEPAIKAVKDGSIRFVPDNWKNTYFNWLKDMQDWCISRQIWWGHRIPAWYDEAGKVYVGRNESEVRSENNINPEVKLKQDEDVLDTWFSSALWPFSTLGWPDKTPELEKFYPTSVLVTGFDIIFFWVARMIMFGVKFMEDVPFREVYITGLIRDSHGHKMSKSKGNVLDPIDLIDGISLEDLLNKRTQGLMQPEMRNSVIEHTKQDFPEGIASFGTDALRFTFASLASTGRDINFDLGRIEGYRNFCNKLWNAARFVLLQLEGQTLIEVNNSGDYSIADNWIRSRLQKVKHDVRQSVEAYRFDHMAERIYDFIWNEYCDWYLELAKVTLNSKDISESGKNASRSTLVQVLDEVLRLLHPLMPYITEEIWQKVAPMTGNNMSSIMLAPYPEPDTDKQNSAAEAEISWLKQLVLGVRQIRGEMNIAPGKRLEALIKNAQENDLKLLTKLQAEFCQIARVEKVKILATDEKAPQAAMALAGNIEILIPLAGLINKEDELKRLNKELEKIVFEINRINAKLSNENFINKAPDVVVKKERYKLSEFTKKQERIQGQISRIAG